MKTICNKCRKEIKFVEPIVTCNLVNNTTYDWDSYILCNECGDELKRLIEGEDEDA